MSQGQSTKRGRRDPNRVLLFRLAAPAAVVLTVALGTIGVLRHCVPPPHWSEAIYDAVQLFALAGVDDCPIDTGTARTTPLILLAAEFLAAVLLFLAVIWLFFQPVWTRVRLGLQALVWPRSRHVLVGFGALNQEIARALAGADKPLTIVSRDFDGAARDFATSAGAILVERDIRQDRSMAGLYLGRCERVVVACGEDSLTYEVARLIGNRVDEAAAGRGRAQEIVHAHFTATDMHWQLLRSRDMGLGAERRFSGFSIREAAAHHLMARAWLVERAVLAGHARLHLVIVGAGDLGMAIARAAVQHGCSADLAPALVSVIDRDGAAARDRFRASMPRLFDATIPEEDRPVFRFLTCTAEAVGLAAGRAGGQAPLRGIGAEPVGHEPPLDDPVTAWVICCPEDSQNLTLAMKLEAAMRQGMIPPAPVYPRQWQANIAEDGRHGLGQADPLHLVAPFGGMDDVVGTLPFLDHGLDTIARAIHAEYETEAMAKNAPYRAEIEEHGMPPWPEGQGPSDPEVRARIERSVADDRTRFRAGWDQLTDEGRLANLEPARHAALRLWELGFDWPGRHAGILPKLQDVYVNANVPGDLGTALDDDTRLARVAEAEHRRWMVERALRGWSAARPGGRSNELRLHHNFETMEALREAAEQGGKDVRAFDATTVRGSLRAMVVNESGPVARRPGAGHHRVTLGETEPISRNAARLTLLLPDVPRDSEEKSHKEGSFDRSVTEIAAWAALSGSLSIRLVPQSAEALDPGNRVLRAALVAIHRAAQAHDVHVWLDFPDATGQRAGHVRIEEQDPA